MLTKSISCRGCGLRLSLTVNNGGRLADARVIDRFRLLAASNGWVIDLNGRAWCPSHKGRAAQ